MRSKLQNILFYQLLIIFIITINNKCICKVNDVKLIPNTIVKIIICPISYKNIYISSDNIFSSGITDNISDSLFLNDSSKASITNKILGFTL